MFGYHGHYFLIELTRATASAQAFLTDLLRDRIGGVGLATELLTLNTPADLPPFDPAAAIVIATSPLVGTPLTTSAKFAVVGKPAHRSISDSSSSRLAILARLKPAGRNRHCRSGARVEHRLPRRGRRRCCRPAVSLDYRRRNRNPDQATSRSGVAVMAISPADERLVRFAAISNDVNPPAAAAWAGLRQQTAQGGSPFAATAGCRSPSQMDHATHATSPSGVSDPAAYRELGAVANLLTFNRLATLPTRNFQQATFEQAEQLAGEALAQLPGSLQRSSPPAASAARSCFLLKMLAPQHVSSV